MSIHLENKPKKEKVPKELKYVSPGTNFLQQRRIKYNNYQNF
jgi:hypothetical protein